VRGLMIGGHIRAPGGSARRRRRGGHRSLGPPPAARRLRPRGGRGLDRRPWQPCSLRTPDPRRWWILAICSRA
jgi:hypothetical protein